MKIRSKANYVGHPNSMKNHLCIFFALLHWTERTAITNSGVIRRKGVEKKGFDTRGTKYDIKQQLTRGQSRRENWHLIARDRNK